MITSLQKTVELSMSERLDNNGDGSFPYRV